MKLDTTTTTTTMTTFFQKIDVPRFYSNGKRLCLEIMRKKKENPT